MNTIEISTRTDLDNICIRGVDVETYVTYIVAEFDNGYRLVLDNSHVQHTVQHNTGLYTHDTVAVIKRLQPTVNKIQKHINAGGKLNLNNWTETDPSYGSDAYCNRTKARAKAQYLFA